jgi:hypothetical protein
LPRLAPINIISLLLTNLIIAGDRCMSRLMEAEVWKMAWGLDRLVFARENDCQLPVIAHEFLRSHGLPRVMIFEGNNPFEIRFKQLDRDLVSYCDTITWGDLYDETLETAWFQQLVIAEEEFCNGRASYCVQRFDGNITRIDVEIPEPEMFVNCGVPQFGESLLLATQWSASNRTNNAAEREASISTLEKAIRAVDTEAFKSRKNFWPFLLDYIREHEPSSFEITSDPARSKSRF